MPFILDGLDTDTYDRNYSDRELLRRIIAYFRPHRRGLTVVAVTLTLNSLAGTAGPILISRAIDIVAAGATTTAIALFAGGILLLGAAAWGFNFVRQMVSARVIGDVVLKLREDVFDATINNDLAFFDQHASGKLVSRVTSDTQDFSNVVTLVIVVLSQVLLVIILMAWILNINAMLTLLVLGMTPLVFGIALSFRHIARRVTRNARRANAKINGLIQESISGIMVAKSFRQESAIYSQFSESNRQAYRVGLRKGFTLHSIFPIMNMASGLVMGLIAYAGGMATRGGGISSGDWYLFMQAVWYFWWPMMSIASFWSQFQDGLSAAERVFSLIDAEPKVKQRDQKPTGRLDGEIVFDQVDFSYSSGEPVLESFSLRIEPGETVAIVGHTGAGKSSIARLVARFYEFQAGSIRVDGNDIRDLDLDDYRRNIGFVPQSPFLFMDSVLKNIQYGRPGATIVGLSRSRRWNGFNSRALMNRSTGRAALRILPRIPLSKFEERRRRRIPSTTSFRSLN